VGDVEHAGGPVEGRPGNVVTALLDGTDVDSHADSNPIVAEIPVDRRESGLGVDECGYGLLGIGESHQEAVPKVLDHSAPDSGDCAVHDVVGQLEGGSHCFGVALP